MRGCEIEAGPVLCKFGSRAAMEKSPRKKEYISNGKNAKRKQAEAAAEDEDEDDLHCFDASKFARIRTNADSTETRMHTEYVSFSADFLRPRAGSWRT